MELNFHIPDFSVHFRLNTLLIELIAKKPEYFHDGLKIASIFGVFPGSVWNGGRYFGGTADQRSVKAVTSFFNSKGIPLRFTFTNPVITEEHLGDPACNMMLRTASNGLNEVIVFSPVLEKYIRENYPYYKLTSSTCKQIEDMDGVIAELEKDYKYVVLDYNWNNRFEELEKIPEEYRSRCEILVNALCNPHCPRRGEHYRHIGEKQIKAWEYGKNPLNKKPFDAPDYACTCMSRSIYDITGLETYISPEAIIEKYLPMGFKNFKIEGRSAPDIALLETYILYMTKPEYRDKARFELLTALTKRIEFFIK